MKKEKAAVQQMNREAVQRYQADISSGLSQEQVQERIDSGWTHPKQKLFGMVISRKFRRENPTVAEYCEKWLLMHSAKVSSATLKGYTCSVNKYIVKPLAYSQFQRLWKYVTVRSTKTLVIRFRKQQDYTIPEMHSHFWDFLYLSFGLFQPDFPNS